MILTTSFGDDFLQISVTSLTVIEPGNTEKLAFILTALTKTVITGFNVTTTDVPVSVVPEKNEQIKFPFILNEGDTIELLFLIASKKTVEGFGIINSEAIYSTNSGEKSKINTDTWLSVFIKTVAPDEGLTPDLRDRLINVVNYRVRNGHIFLADYEKFFNDFLNIFLSEQISGILFEEFNFHIEGLPLNEEIRYLVIIGIITFYAIEQLELIAEEVCNESDDKFEAFDIMEVKRMEE